FLRGIQGGGLCCHGAALGEGIACCLCSSRLATPSWARGSDGKLADDLRGQRCPGGSSVPRAPGRAVGAGSCNGALLRTGGRRDASRDQCLWEGEGGVAPSPPPCGSDQSIRR